MARNEQSSLKRFFTSRLFLLIALVAAVLVAVGFARAYYQDYKVRQEIKQLKEEIQSLEKKKFESLQFLDYVTSDRFIEEKARVELNLKKPDEHVIFIQDLSQDGTQAETAADPGLDRKPLSNPRKWWYYITRTPYPSDNP